MYAFRTPSLRNVALTAPYGHDGAYSDLRAFVTAHLDPVRHLDGYQMSHSTLPDLPVDDGRSLVEDTAAIAQAVTMKPVVLNEKDISDLLAFLDTLTDPIAQKGRLGVPDVVPSGLTVPRLR